MMNEQTLKLNIPLLIPGLSNHQDACLDRLDQALQSRKGIQRAHIERAENPPVLCLHYDPAVIGIADVRRMAERAGAKIANRFHHEVIAIEGLDCSDCVIVLEHSLKRLDGVLDVRVSYTIQKVFIEYDATKISRAAIQKRIEQLGYRVEAEGVRRWYGENRELLFSLMSGLLLLIGWFGERFFGFPQVASLGLYLGAYAFGGFDIGRHALHSLRERKFDTDLLMVMAALGAAVLGEFAEGALLLFLFSLGHALEERALDRARSAIRSLADLTPKTALVRNNGQEVEVPVESLELEAVVIVRPGTRIPVDGVVLQGSSVVDQSPVTGESVPVEKVEGDTVFGGTINGEGALEVRVTRLAKDSTLARVMQMVEAAQAQKSPTQQLTERFMGWFVPAVLIGDLLLILIPPLFGVPFSVSFLRAMTLLVAASPCALALGTPSAILSGVARAARSGVLLKGGVHLENLGRLRAIAFDKTGTVTRGKPELTDVIATGQLDEAGVLALAAAVEARSAHPLALAVVRAAQEQKLEFAEAVDARAVTGRGIQAEVDGKPVWLGNLKLFQEAGLSIPRSVLGQAAALEGQGKTTMIVTQDQIPVGIIAVADVVRRNAKQVIAKLHGLGLEKSVMLTGDNDRVAGYIAGEVGVTECYADLMPEDKVKRIKELVEKHRVVAMVGDGVNDAPALAYATVGVAMGGAGTDVALETADVALMADDLSKLPFAVGLGRAARAIIQQNLVIALGVIALLMISSIFGWAGIGWAILFHEGSTILVALNSLRLLSYSPSS